MISLSPKGITFGKAIAYFFFTIFPKMLPVAKASREGLFQPFSPPDYDVFFARMVESVPQ
jgi:hypothetical protein